MVIRTTTALRRLPAVRTFPVAILLPFVQGVRVFQRFAYRSCFQVAKLPKGLM